MQALRRYLNVGAILLMALQAAGVIAPAAGGCGSRRSTGVVCMCCRTGSGDECPMCRTRQNSARCGCGCQRRDTAPPSLMDVVAILPDRPAEHVDITARPACSVDTQIDDIYCLTPPSPPPWCASAFDPRHIQ